MTGTDKELAAELGTAMNRNILSTREESRTRFRALLTCNTLVTCVRAVFRGHRLGPREFLGAGATC